MKPLAQPQLFFAINQHLLDGSAHALYCARNCWWLAKARPGREVYLVWPGSVGSEVVLESFGFAPLANLHLVGLPSLRRVRGSRGLTIDQVFYLTAYLYLRNQIRAGDWLACAGFPKLFDFLIQRAVIRKRARTVYEVHLLLRLVDRRMTPRAQAELDVLEKADLLLTTSEPLCNALRKHLPSRTVVNVGLACGFSPENFPPARTRAPEESFTLAYIGSVYPGQGVDWLIQEWKAIQAVLPEPVELAIVGGTDDEQQRLKQIIADGQIEGVSLRGAIPANQLEPFLAGVDALIIPSLPTGRMPFVAITKAYDYLGLNRPIIAADLPSIREVLRPGLDAIMFDPGDSVRLSEALQSLLADSSLGGRLVTNAALRTQDFTWENRAQRWWTQVEGD